MRTLIALLDRQRRAVGEHDLSTVEETVHGSQRILLTLGEAKKRRARLVEIIAGDDPVDIADLEGSLGDRLGPKARRAWASLKEIAQSLSDALAVNQEILREAIRFGEEYVRAIYGGSVPDGAGYTAEARPSAEGSGGVLINRRV